MAITTKGMCQNAEPSCYQCYDCALNKQVLPTSASLRLCIWASPAGPSSTCREPELLWDDPQGLWAQAPHFSAWLLPLGPDLPLLQSPHFCWRDGKWRCLPLLWEMRKLWPWSHPGNPKGRLLEQQTPLTEEG